EPRLRDDDYIRALSSASLSDRYAAAKALSHLTSAAAREALIKKLNDDQEEAYVRFECAAGLARLGEEVGWRFIQDRLSDGYLSYRLEAVIILAEIPGDRSCALLTQVIRDRTQHPEIRAGAAWALGEMRERDAIPVLI